MFSQLQQKMLEDNEQFHAECLDFENICGKLNEMTTNLSQQIEFISNQVQRSLRPKMNHYFNALCSLNRKKEKAEADHAVCEGNLKQKLQEGASEVEGKLSIARNFQEELAQADEEFKQLESAFSEAESGIEAEGVNASNIESLEDEIKACEAYETQISSENEELAAALEQLQAQSAHEEQQLNLFKQEEGLKKEQGQLLEAEIKQSEVLIDELTWLLSEVQNHPVPFDDFLEDEVFQRHLFTQDFFESLKSSIEMFEDDNTDLNSDMITHEAQLNEQVAELEKVRNEINGKRNELAELQLKNQSSDQDQAAMQQEHRAQVEAAEKHNSDSLKQVLELQSAIGKAQDELQKAKIEKDQSLKKQEKTLKDEKAKTLKAQVAARATEGRRSSVSSVKSEKNATPVKQELVAIKLEPGISSTQPQKVLKVDTPQKDLANTQPVLQPRRSVTPAEVNPPEVSRYKLTRENLKRRSDLMKENDMPVSLDETIQSVISPKRSRLEEEKAFDSDDSTSVSVFYFWARLALKVH